MTRQHDIGNMGERLAVEYLEHKGYRILALNWRYRRAEVDIVAQDGKIIVFVEVKTRSYDHFGPPDLAINERKEALIASAAHAWIGQHQYEGEIRFDVISILLQENFVPRVHHIKDAFFPGL